tara:strand:- start:31602 stop:31739 length:138 start_codon:yes stop_codon:yes gene_type:complete
MIFLSKRSKKAIARFLVKKLNRKPDKVAKFLGIGRATVYRCLKDS